MKKRLWLFIGWCSAATAFGNIGGFCAAVDAEGTNAYVAAGRILLALDVSDASAPELSNSRYLPGLIEDVLVEGTNLYVACGAAGVHRINTSMELLASYDSSGHAYALALAGSSLYLADGVSGLQVLDSSTLALNGSFVTNGPAMDVLAEGSAVYLLDHFNGVIKLDGSLNQTGAYGLLAFGQRMATDGSLLYATDGLGTITQIDMGTMALAANAPPGLPTFGILSGMAIDGGRLYVAEGFGGLSIYDVSTETLLGSFSAVARSRATAIANGLAYVASGNEGVKIFDLSVPTDPAYLHTVGCSNALDVTVSGRLLLVADAFQGLELFDLTFPEAPAHLGSYKPPSPAVVRCVGATGFSAYIGTGYTVLELDISNPAAPVLVNSQPSPDYVFEIQSSNPLIPLLPASFESLVHAMQLTLSGNTLYASTDDGGTVFVPITNDTDDDGLDDGVEQLIIDADPDDAFIDLAGVKPGDDFDGDGLSNLHEQLAGTSPVDPESVFAICGLEGESSGHAVSWYSCIGHTYTIHKSTNLVEGFTVLQSGIPCTAPVNTYVDPEAGDCAMYMITID